MKRLLQQLLGDAKSRRSIPSRTLRQSPSLEPLENRWVPSVTVTQSINFARVSVNGDNLDNQVLVSLDDANDVLTIVADGTPYTFTSSQIRRLRIDLGDGDNELWMGLAAGSDMLFNKTTSIDTGICNDTVTLDFWQGINNSARLASNLLDISADTGKGTDELDADFAWKDGGTLSLFAKMGEDNDTATARMWGDVGNGTVVHFDLRGGSGNDTIGAWNTYDNIDMAYGSIGVAANSTFSINMDGGPGRDLLSLTYSGEMDGNLVVYLRGGTGNDQIDAGSSNRHGIRLQNGSTGSVDAEFHGDIGNDGLAVSLIQEIGKQCHDHQCPHGRRRRRGWLSSRRHDLEHDEGRLRVCLSIDHSGPAQAHPVIGPY